MSLSVVIPVYNEEENIFELIESIEGVFRSEYVDYEVIFVNDGSTDKTEERLNEIAQRDSKYKAIHFRRNFGQTAAISAGIVHATGDVIVMMDGDLQNNPKDIPMMLKKLDEGYDLVSGWRKNRKDKALSRIIPSKIANALISWVTGVTLHDYGCTLKAYRSVILKDIKLYGEMHRFIPAYAAWRGARITEVVVDHLPRKYGVSKYGISRTFKVVLDLFVVKFFTNYSAKSMYFFGGLGLMSFFFGILSGLLAMYLNFYRGIDFITTPLPLLTVLLILVGIQLLVMGLLSDILMRTYYESGNITPYTEKEKVNFTSDN